MNRLVTNRAALRYSDGREYLVCPAVMIRPGVLSANNGSILYGERLLKDRPGRWNGVPLTLNHPKDARGRMISAGDADARGFVIGRVDGVHYARGGLRAAAWFDIDRTERLAPGLLERVNGGGPLEVSTGLVTRTVSVGGVHRGRRFEKTLIGHDPDHLAVLTDEPGACSVRDGCGLVANSGIGPGGFQPTGCDCGGACGGVNIPVHTEEPLADPWGDPTGNAYGADEGDDPPARPGEGDVPGEPPLDLPRLWDD